MRYASSKLESLTGRIRNSRRHQQLGLHSPAIPCTAPHEAIMQVDHLLISQTVCSQMHEHDTVVIVQYTSLDSFTEPHPHQRAA